MRRVVQGGGLFQVPDDSRRYSLPISAAGFLSISTDSVWHFAVLRLKQKYIALGVTLPGLPTIPGSTFILRGGLVFAWVVRLLDFITQWLETHEALLSAVTALLALIGVSYAVLRFILAPWVRKDSSKVNSILSATQTDKWPLSKRMPAAASALTGSLQRAAQLINPFLRPQHYLENLDRITGKLELSEAFTGGLLRAGLVQRTGAEALTA